MEGSAILCTRGAMAAGAGMIRLGNPGNPAAAWPTEAVRVHLEGPRWAEAFLSATGKCRAMVDRAGARDRRHHAGGDPYRHRGAPRTRW